jgi:hypothetical protein
LTVSVPVVLTERVVAPPAVIAVNGRTPVKSGSLVRGQSLSRVTETPIGSLARSVERGEAGVVIVTRTSFRVKRRTWERRGKIP